VNGDETHRGEQSSKLHGVRAPVMRDEKFGGQVDIVATGELADVGDLLNGNTAMNEGGGDLAKLEFADTQRGGFEPLERRVHFIRGISEKGHVVGKRCLKSGGELVGLQHIALPPPLPWRETQLRPTGDPLDGGIPPADSSTDDDGGIATQAGVFQLVGEALDDLVRHFSG
jgi:hypothetical protein